MNYRSLFFIVVVLLWYFKRDYTFSPRRLEHRQRVEGVFQPSRTATCVLLSASETKKKKYRRAKKITTITKLQKQPFII